MNKTVCLQNGVRYAGAGLSALFSVFAPIASIVIGTIVLRELLRFRQILACVPISMECKTTRKKGMTKKGHTFGEAYMRGLLHNPHGNAQILSLVERICVLYIRVVDNLSRRKKRNISTGNFCQTGV